MQNITSYLPSGEGIFTRSQIGLCHWIPVGNFRRQTSWRTSFQIPDSPLSIVLAARLRIQETLNVCVCAGGQSTPCSVSNVLNNWSRTVTRITHSRTAIEVESNKLLFILLHPFNGLFSRITWLSWRQEGFSGARDDGVAVASARPLCKSFASRSRQITTLVPHHSYFYRPDALHAAQPTAS